MSADLFNLQNADAAQLYAASTFAGLATTAMLAPILFTPLVMPLAAGRMKLEDQDDVCEIVNTPPASKMHQPLYMDDEEEKDWWVCAGEVAQDLADNCRVIYHDDEVKVACAH